ncbi:MAG: lactate utilization protein C [Hyphomicrobiaceae bacterium]
MSDNANTRRTRVFAAIRGQLGAGAGAPARQAAVKARLDGQVRHLIPARVNTDADRLRKLFIGQLRLGFATVIEVGGDEAVPAAVAEFLRGANLPLDIRTGNDSWTQGLAWAGEPALSLKTGRAEPSDEVGVVHAVAGVAETGTLVCASGPDNPVTNTFLPETCIVLLKAADLVGPYEDAFDRIRDRLGRGEMPRTLNLVSGPSRTADVGGRLVTGAHGPRRLCVMIIG